MPAQPGYGPPRGGPAGHGTDPGPYRRRRTAVAGRAGWLEAAIGATSAAVMAEAGSVQWGGVPAAIAWHGASSVVLTLLGAGHAARRTRRRRGMAGRAARADVAD